MSRVSAAALIVLSLTAGATEAGAIHMYSYDPADRYARRRRTHDI